MITINATETLTASILTQRNNTIAMNQQDQILEFYMILGNQVFDDEFEEAKQKALNDT